MNIKRQMIILRKVFILGTLFVFFGLNPFDFHSRNIPVAYTLGTYDPTVQTPTLLYNEARTVYLGNLARRDNGIPPLRWNYQLTQAARWFSWDSTENRPDGFCGHEDTLGRGPWDRAYAYGYLGSSGAENAFCGYVTPEAAIQGWMNSAGHRANLLDPNSREVGLGYYLRDGDDRGYVTQDFGNDVAYAPVIIGNEAISTISPNVNLYIYDRSTGGGFISLGAATQMMVSNNPYFYNAAWEPYSANKAWTLTSGVGWREVYVKTRDKFDRKLTVSDTIYLGGNAPLDELGATQMATTKSNVTIYDLDDGLFPQVQFSLGWLADDTNGTFTKWWGNGERINDTLAWGGTTYRLYPGNGESFAWVWDTEFIKDTPLIAYFRLKVNDNTSRSEVARISVKGGGTEYGPLTLRGTDFTAPNLYQEFALSFTFNSNPEDVFLFFNFWRSGSADVYVDAVSIFSAPQAITSPLTWSIPGNNYRGQGVWGRYTNGSQFSDIFEAVTVLEPVYISGNVGKPGVTLNYIDGMSKTVLSQADGSYSLEAPRGWSGKVTPSHTCYTFDPENRSYSNVFSHLTHQDFTPTFNPASGCANIYVYFGGNSSGSYVMKPGTSEIHTYLGENGGPVVIKSSNGTYYNPPIIASYLQLRRPGTTGGWTGITQTMAFTEGQVSDSYVIPHYDYTDATRYNSLQLANFDTKATNVIVKIGGVERGRFPIDVGSSQNVTFQGVAGGPVEVSSDNGAKIVVSLYELKKATTTAKWTGQTQMMGISPTQLSDTYIIPRYNYTLQDLLPYVVFANASDQETQVSVTIGGATYGPYTLQTGQSKVLTFPGENGGPVVVKSNNGAKIIASYLQLRRPGTTGGWTGITQTMAFTEGQVSDSYVFPHYDYTDATRYNSLQLANFDTKATNVIVKIGGVERGRFPIDVGSSQNVTFSGVVGGPVEVSSDNGAKIVVSLYELKKATTTAKWTGQTQMMGLPTSELSDTYIIPRYNYTLQDLLPYVIFAVP
jgi:uncharacterized protein YkwD